MRKIEATALRLQKHRDLFQCPLCGEKMETEGLSFICRRAHRFDLAKGGYVNLLPHADQSLYSKSLFAARKKVCGQGFFDPLLDKISALIHSTLADKKDLVLLDAGCGEGSHTAGILRRLPPSQTDEDAEKDERLCSIGIDISKEGIKMATTQEAPVIWCVSDLAALPLRSDAFDVVLNILSPANYSEFKRILLPTGYLIKIVPESAYLQEIRGAAYGGQARPPYMNDQVIEGFYTHMTDCRQEWIEYKVYPDPEYLDDILRMTPLTADMDIDLVRNTLLRENQGITAAFRILAGRKENI